ncbi:MAG: glycosyltransferase family 4 protein [Chloroflexi bacterium]|nr:glycosyltransferase family 4 protein [Chloroflexota bacterium]
MRVLMLSKACIVGIYQRKLEEIARRGVELLALVPSSWRDERGETPLERVYTDGYALQVLPIYRNGDFHLHFYGQLGAFMRGFRPDIVHIDEEPYNLAAWQALFWAQRVRARTLFFSWQNLLRRYPPPFSWGEAWTLANVQYALAGTQSAAQVWRAKGYSGPLRVIPQFGTDANLFVPAADRPPRPFTIGYFGRLVEEKGAHLLLAAAAQLTGDWRLLILGSGPQQAALQAQAVHLGIGARVEFRAWVASTQMPALYQQLDALALPSLTRANWKEQFGRVLVEAMSSGVPVVGSDSGAIPDVIGGAGLIFGEGDVPALREALHKLQTDGALYAHLRAAGRARVLAHFTHEQVAAATVAVYESMMA